MPSDMQAIRHIKNTGLVSNPLIHICTLLERISRYGLLDFTKKVVSLVCLSICSIGVSYAATVTWDGGGIDNNWNTCANWAPSDTCPGVADIATFNTTSVKNAIITADPNVAGIDIQAGYSGTLSQNSGVTITVGASGYSQAAGTFTGGDAAFLTEDFTLSGGGFTATSGTMTINDDFILSGGTFNHNSGTVTFTGGGNAAFTLDVVPVLNHVIFNRTNRIDITGTTPTLDINGNFTLSSATDIDGGTILLAGNITTTDTFVTGNSAFTLDGANIQSIDAGGVNAALPNLTINKTAGTLTFLNDVAINASFTHNSGSVDTTTNNVTIQFGLSGSNATTLISSNTMSFNHVTINKSNNLDVSGIMDINGDLTITSATNLDDVAPGDKVTLAGNLVSNAATIIGGLDIEFDGTTDQTINIGSNDLPNGLLTVNKASGTLRLLSNLDLTLGGNTTQDLTISQGALDLAGFNLIVPDILTVGASGTLQLEGDETVTAATTALSAGSTVLYDGTDIQGSPYTLKDWGYHHAIIDGAGAVFNLATAATFGGNLTVSNGTLNTANNAINVGGNFDQSATSSQIEAGTSTITVGGNFTGDVTIDDTDYNNASIVLTGTGSLVLNNLTSYWVNGFGNLTVGQSGNTTTLNQLIAVRNLLTVGTGELTTTGTGMIHFAGAGDVISVDPNSNISITSLKFHGNGVTQNLPTLSSGYDSNIALSGLNTTVTQTGNVRINGNNSLRIFGDTDAARTNIFNSAGFDLDIGGDIIIGAGNDTARKRLDAGSSAINVGGDIVIAGIGSGSVQADFIAGTSTVTLNGTANQSITSSGSSFNNLVVSNAGGIITFADALTTTNLTAVTPGTQLEFAESLTHTISGILNLNGQAATTEVVLTSTSASGVPFTLDVGVSNPQTVNYVDVSDSNVSGSDINAYNSINSGGNDNGSGSPQWVFATVDSFTWTGADVGNNNWDDPDNWFGLSVPGVGDTAIFSSLYNVNANINVAIDVQGIQIDNGYSGTITQQTGNSVTLGSSGYSQASGTFVGGDSLIDVNGPLLINGGSFTSTTGTLEIADALTVDNTAAFSHNGGTIIFTNTSNRTVDTGTASFNNVELNMSGGSMTVNGTFDVDGTLTITGVNDIYSGIISVAGNVITTDSGVGGDARILFNGVNQTLQCDGGVPGCTGAVPGIEVNSSGTLTIDDTIEIEGPAGWTLTAGSIDTTSNSTTIVFDRPGNKSVSDSTTQFNNVVLNMSGGSLTVNGTMNISGDLTITGVNDIYSGIIAVAGNVTTTDTGVRGDATILFNGGNQTLQCDGGVPGCTGALPGIEVNSSGTLTINDTIEIDGSSGWRLTAGAIDATTNATTIVFNTPSNKSVNDSTTRFNNVVLDMSGGSLTVNGTMDIDGDLTIIGVNDIYSGTILVAGDLTTTDTGINGDAGIILDGVSDQNISAAAADFPNGPFTINKLSGIAILQSNLTLNGTGQNLNVSLGTLDLAGFDITVPGALTVNSPGILQLQGGEIVPVPTLDPDSMVIYNGSAATYTLKDWAYRNLTIDDGGGSATFLLPGNLNIAEDFYVIDGIVDTTAANSYAIDVSGGMFQTGGQLQARNSTITVAGNFQADGAEAGDQYNSASLVLTGTGTVAYTSLSARWSDGFGNLSAAQASQTTTLNDTFSVRIQLITGAGALTGPSTLFLWGSGTPLVVDPLSTISIDNLYFNSNSGTQAIPPLSNGYDTHISITNGPLTVSQTGNIILNSGYNLTITGGQPYREAIWNTNGFDLSIGGDLTIGWGNDTEQKRLDATNSAVSIGGNLLIQNIGTGSVQADLIPTGSTVTLNGTASQSVTLNGSGFDTLVVTNTAAPVSFNDAMTTSDLMVTTPGAALLFAAGGDNSHTITGTLNLNGQLSGGEISLGSLTPSSPFTLTVGSPQAVSYVDVSDSDAAGSDITAYNSIDSSGNDNGSGSPQWVFASALIVTNTNDGGAGSLRQAMLDALANDTITFDNTVFPTNSPATITLSSTLPTLSQGGVTIDGSNAGVVIDGGGATCFIIDSNDNSVRGLRIENCFDGVRINSGANNTIGGDYTLGSAPHGEGNIIVNNASDGIEIRSGGNMVTGNYIGTNGSIAEGNNQGIWLRTNAQSNVIGGTTTGLRNVISGNNTGIALSDAATSLNQIIGNYIGTDASGSTAIANGTGVRLNLGTNNNTIGGILAGEGNLISGNTNNGVYFESTGADSNTVAGNLIGTDAVGTAAIANGGFGVYIIAGSANVIGGTTTGAGNVISGNGSTGVSIASATGNNSVSGNLIGTDINGTAALPNGNGGVVLSSGTNGNLIGGNTAAERNVISGNSGIGVYINAGDSNTITGNYIGVDISGTVALGNAYIGIQLRNGSASNTIGGTTPSARNIISANVSSGIRFNDAGTESNLVLGNYIGTDVSGTLDLGNGEDGIAFFSNANANTIGGTSAGARNIISGNNSQGISITSSSNITISGNYIGTDASGSAALGNTAGGVGISSGGGANTIGGNVSGAGNLITANGSRNISISNSSSNTIQGNIIGLNATGNGVLGTTNYGISLQGGASSNTIGGTSAEARNIISGHQINGILIRDAGTTNNSVIGNYIGTDAGGAANAGNATGIQINNSASGNFIGGTALNSGNVISWNGDDGLYINAPSTSNTVLGNFIGTNAGGDAMPNGGDGIDIDGGSMLLGDATEAQANVIAPNGGAGILLRTTETLTLAGTVDLNGDLNLTSGTLDMGSATLQLAGNWINSGANTVQGTSTVTLDGTDQSISGSSTFNNLIKNTTVADTLTFQSGQTQTITGTLDLQGASGNYLSLASSLNGAQWNIDPQGSRNIAFLIVFDSNNTNVLDIDATTNSIDGSGNTGWLFSAIPTFVWTNNSGAGDNNWSTASNWLTGTVPGVGDLATFINNYNYPAQVDVSVDVNGIQVFSGYTSTITQQTGNTIRLGNNGYYQEDGVFSGGDSSLDINGDLTLTGGNFISTSSDLTLTGNLTLSPGSFTHNGGRIIFDSTTANQTLTSAGNIFNNLTLNNTAAAGSNTLIIADALDVNGTLSVGAGDLDIGTFDPPINTAGDVGVNNSGATISSTGRSAIWTFDGVTLYTDTSNVSQDIKDIVITGTLNLGVITLHVRTIHVTSSGVLNLGNGAYRIRVNGTGTPFIMDGTLQLPGTSLFEYTGTGATTNIANVPYSSLRLEPTAPTTYMLTGNQDGSNSLSSLVVSSNATLDASSNNFNLTTNWFTNDGTYLARNSTITASGVWTNSGTFSPGGSTVILNGSTSQDITSGGSSFNTLLVTNASDVVTFTDELSTSELIAVTPGSRLSFTSGTTNTVSGTLDINGQAAGTEIMLTATTPGLAFNLDVGISNPQTVSFVSVQDSDAQGSDITAINSINVSGNDELPLATPPQWVFTLAAPFTWTGAIDNNWSNPGNWFGLSVPGASDTAIFSPLFNVDADIDASVSVGGIQIETGYTATLTQQAGNTLSIGGNGYVQADGRFQGGDGLIDFSDGSFTLTGGVFTNSSAGMTVDRNITVSGGTFTDSGVIRVMDHNDGLDDTVLSCSGPLGGVVEIDKTHANATVTIDAGCAINLGSSPTSRLASTLTNNGTITISGGIWTENGDGTYINNGVLTHNGTGWDSSGSLINTSSGSIAYVGVPLSFERNFSQNGTFDLSGKTITFDGDDGMDDSVLTCGSTLAANVILNKPASDRTFVLGSDCTIQGDFTRITGPILNPSNSYTLSIEGNVTISGVDLTGGTNFTLLMAGGNNQTLAISDDNFDSRLSISKTAGLVSLTNNFSSAGASSTCDILSGTFDLNGNDFSCGSTFTVGSSAVLQLDGGENVNPPVLSSGSTVIYNGGAAYTLKNWVYHHIEFNGAGTWTQASALDVNGDLDILSGTLSSNGSDITLSGNWNKAAAANYLSGTNTVLLDGSNQSITGSSSFNHLVKNVVNTDTLSFQAGSMQTINGLADLQGGDSGNRLLLRSLTPGSRANIAFNGSTSFNFLDIADSDVSSSGVTRPLNPVNSIDSGNNIDWFSGFVNAVTSIVGEITPNNALVSSSNSAFSLYMLPTIAGSDSGFNQSVITTPPGYSNQLVTDVFVNGSSLVPGSACPSIVNGEYCVSVSAQTITINFGTAITSNLTPVRVDFTADTPDTPGLGSFVFAVDDTLTADPMQFGIAGDADSNAANSNSLDVDTIIPVNAVSSVVAEITPDTADSNSQAVPLSVYLRPTINSGDSGLNRVSLTMPAGYNNFNVVAVTVDGTPLVAGTACPSMLSGEYCQLTSSQIINIDFGSLITTNLATIRIDITTATPNAAGTTTFSYSVDDTTTGLVPAQTGMPGNADGDATNSNDLDVTLIRVDPALSTIGVSPEIVVADGSSEGIVTIRLVNSNGLPVSGKSVQISSSRSTVDSLTQPTGVTDSNGIISGSISSSSVGMAQITALNTTDNINLSSAATVYFTQGQVLTLRKSANKSDVAVGDLVTYTVELMNNTNQAVQQVQLEVTIPDNFKYRSGSSLFNGAPVADPTGRRVLSFNPGTIPALIDSNGNGSADPGETGYVKYSYQLVVGSGAMPGVYASTAIANDACDLCVVSNTATAEVSVILDPLFDLGTIIGKVFHDKNGDNWQDKDEPGIAGAMVVLDEGTYAITDSHGRYHFPAVTPGERLLKINLASLPSGTTLSDNTTRVVSVSPGLLAKANFSATQNLVTKKIGHEGVRALMISLDEQPKEIFLFGNAKLQTLIVNGSQVNLPQAEVKMNVNGIPSEVIHFDGKNIHHPALFYIDVFRPEDVASWGLRIMTPDGKNIREFHGKHAPPAFIEWDGIDHSNAPLIGGQLYHYQLTVDYNDGSQATSARRLIGVDQKSIIELNLNGGSFRAGDFTLSKRAMAMLKEAAKTLRRFPREKVVIEGHADASGGTQINLDLSRQRAEAAYAYLVDVEKISPSRLEIRWYGEARPIANNTSNEGRLLNRRVAMKGLVSDVTRAQRRSRFHGKAKASINGEEVRLDSLGRFSSIVEGLSDMYIELKDQHGRSVSARLSVPKFSIIQPNNKQLVAYASVEEKRNNEKRLQLSTSPAHQYYQLIGRAEPGSLIKIGTTEIAISSDGRFHYPISLTLGKQSHQIIVLSPQGFTYITELNIDIRAQDSDKRAYYLEDPVPYLAVDVPEDGFTVKAGNYSLSGRTAPGNIVFVNEQVVNIEPDGQFVHTLNLEQGKTPVYIKVVDPRGYTGTLGHIINAGQSQFFFMAFADGKFSQLKTKGYIQGSGSERSEEFYSEGRIAFYFKGKIKGEYLITAALDTGQSEMNTLFSELDDNTSRALLSNLDPDYYYPVYGDNSTVVYDTQSQGKFYLALDSNTIHSVVGNYKLNLSENELAAYRRTLYGALFEYQSLSRTQYGRQDTLIHLFAAQTRQSYIRDELRATGGSLYYLSQRDIIEGSEQVSLVVKDKNTGLTISRQPQKQNIDYSIKYLGGRLLFTRPISSVERDDQIVNNALLSGNPVYIEVEYEYYVAAFEKRASGAYVRQQLGDHFALGATYVDDELANGRYQLQGVDGEVRIMKNTRVIAEIAQSKGSEGETFSSEDGGLTFSPITAAQKEGQAIKLSTEIDIGEFSGKPDQLKAGAYFKKLEPGFQATGNSGDQGKQKLGANMMVKITDKSTLKLKHDRTQSTGVTQAGSVDSTQQSTAQWAYKSKKWTFTGELNEQLSEDRGGVQLSNNSLAATKLVSAITDKLEASISHQATLQGVANDQSTVGLKYKLTEKIQIQGSATGGDKGDAGEARITYRSKRGNLYLTERFNDDKAGKTTSTIIGGETSMVPIAGAERGKVYSEYQWDNNNNGDRSLSLVGAEQQWAIKNGWRFNLGTEYSDIDALSGTSSRTTVAMGLSYMREGLKLSTRNEIRNDRGAEHKKQMLTSNSFQYNLNPDYIILGKYRYSVTRNLTKDSDDARFDEQSIGLAYRPVRHDIFNALARYTRLSEMSPLNLSDSATPVATKMDVFSVEWLYQISKKFEWSEKQAIRFKTEKTGELAEFETRTHLSIHRLNYALPKKLGFAVEYRVLRQREANDQREGWLAELNWEADRHLRLGVGYNFTDFSDNEFSDNDYSTAGWFIRIQGKY